MLVKTTQCNSNVSIENCQAYVIEEMRNYFLNKSNRLEQEEIKNLIKDSETVQTYFNDITKIFNNEIDIWDFHTSMHNVLVILYPDRKILKECSCCGSEYELIEFHENQDRDIYHVCYNCLKKIDSQEDYISKYDCEHITTVDDAVDMRDCYSNSINYKEELPF